MESARKLYRRFTSLFRNEKGQTVIEYVLVIVLIAIVLLFAFNSDTLKTSITGASTDIAGAIDSGVAQIP